MSNYYDLSERAGREACLNGLPYHLVPYSIHAEPGSVESLRFNTWLRGWRKQQALLRKLPPSDPKLIRE